MMKPCKILVVDDEAHITHVVSMKLRKAGHDVTTASDGEEGYEMACQMRPDLVITDLQMPYMNGLQLAEKLRANKQLASTPVLVLTARGYALSSEDLAKTNIKGMLSKPFSPREVLERVDEALGNDQPQDGTREAA